MLKDLLHAVRMLVRQYGFSAAAVLTLALGIGANAAVFAVAWHLVLKPLPWTDADRLVQVWNTYRPTDAKNVVAPANFVDFVREARTFDALAAYTYFSASLNLTGAGEPTELRVRAVTGDYFDVFRTPAILGRTLNGRDVGGQERVIVLGEGLWRRQFGADPGVVGRRILLDDLTHEIVGVMPAWFDVSARPLDGWVPYFFTPELRERRLGYFLGVVGRLKTGVSAEQARQDIEAVAGRASQRHPTSNASIGATLNPLRDEIVGPVRTGMLLLACGAGLVLLIACANLTSLQLARATGRERELAVRSALGATRPRLIRMLLTESLVIAVLAGYAGLIVGLWTVRAMAIAAPPNVARAAALTLDPNVIIYTFAMAVVSGLAFAGLPAWRATRPAPIDALRGRTSTGRGTRRIRTTLVTAEVALATMLVVAAVVLVTSMVNVLRVDPGFDPSGVIAADLRLPSAERYETVERRAAFFDRVVDGLRGVPGVSAACATNAIPLENEGRMTYVPDGTQASVGALPLTVSPDCFKAFGITLVRGRLFDGVEPEPVAVVSEGFARRAFPQSDAVGHVIRIGIPTGEPLTIVGIVRDSRRVSIEATPYGQVYEPASQSAYFAPSRIVIRAEGPIEGIVTALRQVVSSVDSLQPVANVRLLEDVVARSLASRRFNLNLLGSFAVLALVLAAVGVYGLLTQLVAERRAEIGVRMALGADRSAIVRLVMGGAIGAVCVGVSIGLAGAWAAARVLAGFAFEVSPTDPGIYAGTAAFLAVVAALAAGLPAWWATRIDPMAALRAE